MATTRTFKSGNSIAVRLPKSLGVAAGVEMRVREEGGRYVLEPIGCADRIDLTGIYGSMPELKPLEDRTLEARSFEWSEQAAASG